MMNQGQCGQIRFQTTTEKKEERPKNINEPVAV